MFKRDKVHKIVLFQEMGISGSSFSFIDGANHGKLKSSRTVENVFKLDHISCKEVISIGVKFGREYNDIVDDLSEAIVQVESFYDFLDMNEQDWNRLTEFDQKECLKTLADDVFFALGNQQQIQLGRGVVFYSRQKHIITVQDGQNVTIVVKLT